MEQSVHGAISARVGCCGWPVARARYNGRLGAVEVNSSFYCLPRLETARGWAAQAPAGFQFALKAWQVVTHAAASPTYRRLPRSQRPGSPERWGHFRPTPEVEGAWERTLSVARALGARLVLVQTPPSFIPSSRHLGDMYRFFKGVRRDALGVVWEPRGPSWTARLVERVCGDLGLIPGGDPLGAMGWLAALAPAAAPLGYYRLHGPAAAGVPGRAQSYSDEDLRRLLDVAGGRPAYFFFNNVPMWDDALRFQELLGPPRGPSTARGGPARPAALGPLGTYSPPRGGGE